MAGLIKAALAPSHRGAAADAQRRRARTPAGRRTSPFVLRTAAAPWPRADAWRRSARSASAAPTSTPCSRRTRRRRSRPALASWPAELFLFRGRGRDALRARARRARPRHADGRVRRGSGTSRAARAVRSARSTSRSWSRDARGPRAQKIAAVRDGSARLRRVHPSSGRSPGRASRSCFPARAGSASGMLARALHRVSRAAALLELGARWPRPSSPAARSRPKTRAAQQRGAHRHARRAAGARHRRPRRSPICSQRSAFGPRCSRATATASSSRCAWPVRSTRERLLALSEVRGQRILEPRRRGRPGTMAAVAARGSTTARTSPASGRSVLANQNSPDSRSSRAERGGRDAPAARSPTRASPRAPSRSPARSTARSSHGARDTFAADLATRRHRPAALPVYSNTTARPYGSGADDVRGDLRHIGSRCASSTKSKRCTRPGRACFVEAVPGGVLTGLVGHILGKRPHVAVACEAGGATGIGAFLSAVARLSLRASASDRHGPLFAGRRRRARPTSWPSSSKHRRRRGSSTVAARGPFVASCRPSRCARSKSGSRSPHRATRWTANAHREVNAKPWSAITSDRCAKSSSSSDRSCLRTSGAGATATIAPSTMPAKSPRRCRFERQSRLYPPSNPPPTGPRRLRSKR